MAAGESGTPAPYAFVGKHVEVRYVGGDHRDERGVLEDVSTLGAEIVSEGERRFIPWSGVLRLTLDEDAEPGG